MLALAALFVAGCGGDDAKAPASDATTTPVAEATLTPDEIVTQSMAAMEKTNSGSFTRRPLARGQG